VKNTKTAFLRLRFVIRAERIFLPRPMIDPPQNPLLPFGDLAVPGNRPGHPDRKPDERETEAVNRRASHERIERPVREHPVDALDGSVRGRSPGETERAFLFQPLA
jgi:hypothetical protein